MNKKEMKNMVGNEEIAGLREKCYANREAPVSQPIARICRKTHVHYNYIKIISTWEGK
jgi:hypothetical protein